MITGEQIEALIERLINRIEEANTYFLMKMGASVRQIRELTPTQAQQLVQMLKYDTSYDDIIRELAKYTDMNVKDLDDIFSAYAKKDREFYKQFYQYRRLPFVESEAMRKQRLALTRLVKNEMYNFTRTNVLGYTIRDLKGRPQFLGLRETYNRVLDEALLNVGQGKESFDSAMTRIMKEIGGSGLKTVDFESGRSMRLDSAVRMQLKGRLRELHNENQKIIGEEIGSNGVEISTHSHPAPDHLMQGHQFSNEEFEKLQSGQEATDYKGKKFTLDHDGNGSYRPISEMSCYHYIFSIILGISQPEYNEEELQKIIDENNEGFNFENKHYTMYQGEQLLRKVELELRKSKDIQILARSSNNAELVGEMQSRVTQLTSKYRDILKASGLKSKLERAKVSGYRRTKIK